MILYNYCAQDLSPGMDLSVAKLRLPRICQQCQTFADAFLSGSNLIQVSQTPHQAEIMVRFPNVCYFHFLFTLLWLSGPITSSVQVLLCLIPMTRSL